MKEAKESKTPITKTFKAQLPMAYWTFIDLFCAGKGDCCIPVEGTYGPLLSALRASPVHPPLEPQLGHSTRRRAGVIVGFAALGTATAIMLITIAILWLVRIEIAGKIAQTTTNKMLSAIHFC